MGRQFNVSSEDKAQGGECKCSTCPLFWIQVSVGQVNPEACVYLESVSFTSLQVVAGVCSWCYPRARKLTLPPSLVVSCLPGEFRVRTAWFGFVFMQRSLLSSKGEEGWLHSSCGFGSCWHRAPRSQVRRSRATAQG